jgi:hypothetical protein
LRLHWTLDGAEAGAGRHQRSSQHGVREAREKGDRVSEGAYVNENENYKTKLDAFFCIGLLLNFFFHACVG